MELNQNKFFSSSQLSEILGSFQPKESVAVVRIRYKNQKEIRKSESMSIESLKELLLESMEEGNLFGGDLEVFIPNLNSTLIGHHDGVFWLKKTNEGVSRDASRP